MVDTTTLLGAMSRRKLMVIAGLGTAALGVRANAAEPAATPAATRAAKKEGLSWPVRGSFGGKAVIGPHQASAAAMVDDRPILGLPRERTFFSGNLRDSDGNLYDVVRSIAGKGVGGMNSLFVQSNKGNDTLRAMPELMKNAATSDGADGRLVGTDAVWASPVGASGKPFQIGMSQDGSRATWKEDGIFDLSGELLGPGLQWHIPDEAGSELYVSQIYEMKGDFQGRTVRGIMELDQSYLPEGMLMYSGKDPLFRPDMHHRCWYTWGTRYTDGSYDCGHFVLGTDRLGFALITNERGELTLDTDVTGQIELFSGDIWPKRIVINTKGGPWEFLPDPKGRMVDMLNGAVQSWTPQNEGRWRKVNDHREPAVWFAWGEVQAPDKIAYSQHTRF